ncbi:hypothetical protein FAES_1350 [Fibrella aestuarina BUZ 2]|uniref:Uncharacterized protein n=1 Tax=Fibrella aestuarina BUZ 2 TaxID=1166018 RepID=I0K5F7_9BACT|nr:hypothetical protein FAES_1350 [Fibrella aestuarina BUZ 2]
MLFTIGCLLFFGSLKVGNVLANNGLITVGGGL